MEKAQANTDPSLVDQVKPCSSTKRGMCHSIAPRSSPSARHSTMSSRWTTLHTMPVTPSSSGAAGLRSLPREINRFAAVPFSRSPFPTKARFFPDSAPSFSTTRFLKERLGEPHSSSREVRISAPSPTLHFTTIENFKPTKAFPSPRPTTTARWLWIRFFAATPSPTTAASSSAAMCKMSSSKLVA